MKLYGTPPTRAIRVQWLLNELGVECEVIGLNPLAPDTAFLALNPAGKLPVLVDGDVVQSLPRSRCILPRNFRTRG